MTKGVEDRNRSRRRRRPRAASRYVGANRRATKAAEVRIEARRGARPRGLRDGQRPDPAAHQGGRQRRHHGPHHAPRGEGRRHGEGASSCSRSTREQSGSRRAALRGGARARRGRRSAGARQPAAGQRNYERQRRDPEDQRRRSCRRSRSSSSRRSSEVNKALLEAVAVQREAGARPTCATRKQALSRTTILAPMTRQDHPPASCEEGETAIMGTLNRDAATLLTIADMSVLETKVKVDETDVAAHHGGRLGGRSRSTPSPTRPSSAAWWRSPTARSRGATAPRSDRPGDRLRGARSSS